MRSKFKKLTAVLLSAMMVLPFFGEYPSGTFDIDWDIDWSISAEETSAETEEKTTSQVWDGTTVATSFAGGSGTQEDPYQISNGAELAFLAQQVNSGTNYDGLYFKLTADIDLGNHEWTPIGCYIDTNDQSPNTSYLLGTFDGDGHVIKNLKINLPSEYNVGLFGYSEGTIKNVGIEGGSVTGKGDVGGVCGWNLNGTIENCYNTASVTGENNVGGVCGENSGTITNCYTTKGGVYGENSGTITNCYTTKGGVYGENSGTITNCYYLADKTNSETGAITLADLCKLDFDSDDTVWTAGSVSATADEDNPRFGTMLYVLPSLNGVGNAQTYKPETETKAYNFGTTESPDWQEYTEIKTAEELQAIGNDATSLGKNYVLMNEIDMSDITDFTPIGNDTTAFTGKFSGNGNVIKNLTINLSEAKCVGLFGFNSGTIMNVGIEAGNVTGKSLVGGVCGNNSGTITNCYNTAKVKGSNAVGGVCGYNYSGTITNCYNTASVTGNNYVGGMCGDNSGTITTCYNTGSVTGTNTVDGVCGDNSGTITNCYAVETYAKTGTITLAALCESTLPTGFNSSVWKAGSVSVTPDSEGSRFGNVDYILPSLNGVGTAQKVTVKSYNFGINMPDWQEYTEIKTAAGLQAIGNDATSLSGNYVLMNEIDMSGVDFTAIGSETTPFTGNFSGGGHVIKNLAINMSDKNYVGLFGFNKGTIMNVGLEGGSVTGKGYVGSLCGWNVATIINCYNTGKVTGNNNVGGLCGNNAEMSNVGTGTITNCYNTGNVTIQCNNNTFAYAGGISGSNNSEIRNCYNTGVVELIGSLNDGAAIYIGSVCGYISDNVPDKCYYLKGTIKINEYVTEEKGTGNETDSNPDIDNTIPKTLAELCVIDLDSAYNNAAWTAGSVSATADKDNPRFGTMLYVLPSLNGVGNAQTYKPETETKAYNFSITEGEDDWQEYTPITKAEELQAINEKLDGNYVLMNDIDMSTITDFTPIGNDTTLFTGKFSGNDKKITNLTINKSDINCVGLFGMNDGLIMNVNIASGSVKGARDVGGVCGVNNGTIINCTNSANVEDGNTIGGVCGLNSDGKIENCSNTGNVVGKQVVGGVCGANISNNATGTIINCKNTGNVVGMEIVGGVCGFNNGTITNCKNTGNVVGMETVGGVYGENTGTISEDCTNTGIVISQDMFTIAQKTYNGQEQTADITVNDEIKDKITYTATYYSDNTAVTSLINAGTYTVKLDISDKSGNVIVTDYEIKTFTINQLDFSALANAGNLNSGVQFIFSNLGTDDVKLDKIIIDGCEIPSDDFEAVVTDDNEYNNLADYYSYKITFTSKDTVNVKDGTLSLNVPKQASVTVSPSAYNRTYDGSTKALLSSGGEASNGTMVYSLNENGIYTTNIPTARNAGVYTVWYMAQGNAGAENSDKSSVQVTIRKRSASISKPTAIEGLTYNGMAQQLVTAGSTAGGTMMYSVNDGDFSSSIPTAVDPGTYTVYFYSTSSTNYYSSSIFSVQVTIAPADYDDLATVSVTLTDGIRLIFALEFSDLALADKNAYLQFSLDDGTVLGTQKITEATVDSKGRYKFTCPLLADQMTENINAQMFYSDGVEGDVYSYSVKQYADTVIANEATFGAKTVNLVKAMLNYGGYAQKYTGKNTSNLANSDLSDMAVDDKTVSIGDDYKISRKGAVTGLKIKSFKLVIDDLTEIQIGCQVQNGYDISDFDFSCDKGEVTIYEGEQEGYYYISIKKITPDKLDDIYSVTVTGEDSEITVYCSAFTYFKTVLESSAYDEKIVNLIKAMYEYNQASTNYVNG